MAIIKETDLYIPTDIRDVLNEAGGSVTDDTVTFFSAAAKLNMWSKYKPVVSASLFADDDKRWKGDDGKCGLTILSKETSMEDFHTYLDDGTALWSYMPPAGGVTEPMRIGDFRGYNTDAVNPIGELTTNGISENGSATTAGTVEFAIDVVDNLEYNLTYGDISVNGVALTGFYLGIYAVKDGNWVYKTNSVPLGSSYSFQVSIPLTTGEWKIIPFFCSVAQDGVTGVVGTYLGANVPAKTFTIISSSDQVQFYVYGVWNETKTKVTGIYVEINNGTSQAIVMDRISVMLYGSSGNTDVNVGSPATVYYQGSASNTITIPANSSVTTVDADFQAITLGDTSEGYEYFIRASGYVGDTLYSDTMQIDENNTEAYKLR